MQGEEAIPMGYQPVPFKDGDPILNNCTLYDRRMKEIVAQHTDELILQNKRH